MITGVLYKEVWFMGVDTKIREVYESDIDSKSCISCMRFEDFKNRRKTECCHKCVMEKGEAKFGWIRSPNLRIIR